MQSEYYSPLRNQEVVSFVSTWHVALTDESKVDRLNFPVGSQG